MQTTSFVSGAAMMVLEMVGSRLVAPYFGTSLIVWTSMIGVIMISLCIGNWLGGHLADRRPTRMALAFILGTAAAIVALTAWGGNVLLALLNELGQNLYATSLVAALVVFAPASILLGMVSPFTAKLALVTANKKGPSGSGDGSGTILGHLSALNSLGSIFGTFLGGFVLISLWPSWQILMGVAVTLAALVLLLCLGGSKSAFGLDKILFVLYYAIIRQGAEREGASSRRIVWNCIQ